MKDSVNTQFLDLQKVAEMMTKTEKVYILILFHKFIQLKV